MMKIMKVINIIDNPLINVFNVKLCRLQQQRVLCKLIKHSTNITLSAGAISTNFDQNSDTELQLHYYGFSLLLFLCRNNDWNNNTTCSCNINLILWCRRLQNSCPQVTIYSWTSKLFKIEYLLKFSINIRWFYIQRLIFLC